MPREFKVVVQLKLSEKHGPMWIIAIPAVKSCDSYGRSLMEARRSIREVLAATLPGPDGADVAATAVFEEEIQLPPTMRTAVRRWHEARARTAKIDEAMATSRAAEASAARAVTEHLSLRDAGELLGLSPEGVRKVAHGGPGVLKTRAAPRVPREAVR
jgi:predicted RNase H-like HicB family nuclease